MSPLTLEEAVFYSLPDKSSGKDPQQVAAEMGIKYNTLMRKVSFTDDATALFVHELVPYMKATGDFQVLDKLNQLSGRLYVPEPRGVRKGTNPKQDVNDYTQKFMKMITKLIRHIEAPSDDLYGEIEKMMKKHIGESVNMHRRAKKHLLHQTELEF